MIIVFSAAVLLALCLVLRGADPGTAARLRTRHGATGQDLMSAKATLRPTPAKEHGKGLADHGKELQEVVAGGKKCPHCGKAI